MIRPFAWAIAGILVLGLAVFVWRRIRTIKIEEAARAARATPAERDAVIATLVRHGNHVPAAEPGEVSEAVCGAMPGRRPVAAPASTA